MIYILNIINIQTEYKQSKRKEKINKWAHQSGKMEYWLITALASVDGSSC